MTTKKTSTLSFRIEPNLKEALLKAAKLEHRSVTNMIEHLIKEYCEHHQLYSSSKNEHVNSLINEQR